MVRFEDRSAADVFAIVQFVRSRCSRDMALARWQEAVEARDAAAGAATETAHYVERSARRHLKDEEERLAEICEFIAISRNGTAEVDARKAGNQELYRSWCMAEARALCLASDIDPDSSPEDLNRRIVNSLRTMTARQGQ